MDWKEYKIGEVGKFKYGKGLSEQERTESGNPVYSSAGIVGYSNEFLVKRGIIVGRKGNAGSVYFSDVPFYPIDTAFFIDEVLEEHDLKFFFYVLGTVSLVNFAGDAAVPGLNREVAESIKIKLPPLPIQRRIAEILGRYDALIENYAAQIRTLEASAQNLYREWFIRFRIADLGLRIDENTKLPVGWEVESLYDLVETQYGFTASATDENTGVKFLRITDISGTTLDWENVPFCEVSDDDSEKYKLVVNDVVIARIGATAGYAKRINKNHPKAVFASYLVKMQAKKSLHGYFIGMTIESDYFKDFINKTAGGSAQPQANAPVLTSYKTVLPSDAVLEKFNKLVEPMFDKIEILQNQITKLRQMRDKLLPRLLSGKIEIKV